MENLFEICNKDIKFYSFEESIEVKDIDHEELGSMKICEFEDEGYILIQLENSTRARITAASVAYDPRNGYASFINNDDEVVFQLFLGEEGYIIFTEEEDHIAASFNKYEIDILSECDASEGYPIFKYDCRDAYVNGANGVQRIVYGDIFIKKSITREWEHITRINEANIEMFSLSVARYIGELRGISSLFILTENPDTSYYIDEKLYRFNRITDQGFIFNPMPIYDYQEEENEILYRFTELARMTIPTIDNNTFFVLEDSIVHAGEIVSDVSEIEPIYTPSDRFDESLFYKYDEVVQHVSNVNAFVMKQQVSYSDAIEVYKAADKKVKEIRKEFNRVIKTIPTKIFGTRPVFVMYKYGRVYSISKEDISVNLNTFASNLDIATNAFEEGKKAAEANY